MASEALRSTAFMWARRARALAAADVEVLERRHVRRNLDEVAKGRDLAAGERSPEIGIGRCGLCPSVLAERGLPFRIDAYDVAVPLP